MSLDRLKALIAATALLAVLGACNAGAETAQDGSEAATTAQPDAAAALALSFDDLPAEEREARLQLSEQIKRLTTHADFAAVVQEHLMEGARATIPMNYPDITEQEMAEADELLPRYTTQHEGFAHQRIVELYAELYTIEELEDLAAFFASETGMKYTAMAGEMQAGVNSAILDTVGIIHNDVMRIVRPESFGMEPRQPGDAPAGQTPSDTPEGETVIDLNAAPAETPETSTDSEE